MFHHYNVRESQKTLLRLAAVTDLQRRSKPHPTDQCMRLARGAHPLGLDNLHGSGRTFMGSRGSLDDT